MVDSERERKSKMKSSASPREKQLRNVQLARRSGLKKWRTRLGKNKSPLGLSGKKKSGEKSEGFEWRHQRGKKKQPVRGKRLLIGDLRRRAGKGKCGKKHERKKAARKKRAQKRNQGTRARKGWTWGVEKLFERGSRCGRLDSKSRSKPEDWKKVWKRGKGACNKKNGVGTINKKDAENWCYENTIEGVREKPPCLILREGKGGNKSRNPLSHRKRICALKKP